MTKFIIYNKEVSKEEFEQLTGHKVKTPNYNTTTVSTSLNNVSFSPERTLKQKSEEFKEVQDLLCNFYRNNNDLFTVLKLINCNTQEELEEVVKIKQSTEGYSTRHKAAKITPKANEQERKVLGEWEAKPEDYKHLLEDTSLKKYECGEKAFKNILELADPNKIKEEVGVKQNIGKLPMDKMISIQFPKALEAVCRATLFGHNKYKETDKDFLNFKRVEEGSQAYADAIQRHNLNKAQTDDESGLPHIYHKCWNALAELELWIEENEKQK